MNQHSCCMELVEACTYLIHNVRTSFSQVRVSRTVVRLKQGSQTRINYWAKVTKLVSQRARLMKNSAGRGASLFKTLANIAIWDKAYPSHGWVIKRFDACIKAKYRYPSPQSLKLGCRSWSTEFLFPRHACTQEDRAGCLIKWTGKTSNAYIVYPNKALLAR